MTTKTASEPRALRAKELSAQRQTLLAMKAYIDRMAPLWSDAQFVEALRQVSRQRKRLYNSLRERGHARDIPASPKLAMPARHGEVGMSHIEVTGLFGLARPNN